MREATIVTAEDKQKSVLYFTSPTCAPCKILGPMMEELSKDYTDVDFIRISIDKAPEVTLEEGIMGVPTVKFYHEGEEVRVLRGLKERDEYIESLEASYNG